MARPIAIALTIAGSDCSGGAGIQADLKSFAAHGVYGASVVTAVTAQNTRGVAAIHSVPSQFVRAQIDAVMSDLAVKAIKIGMLASAEIIDAVSHGLAAWPSCPMVLDPVMVAQSGADLIDAPAIDALRHTLLPHADLLTPNIPEAARLLNQAHAHDAPGLIAQGQALLALGARAVLMKGGHGQGPESIDYLVMRGYVRAFHAPRLATRNTHGTGCSLSSAIAARLARGEALPDAIEHAKAWLTQAIRHADELEIGHGAGPVHHFHAWWDKNNA